MSEIDFEGTGSGGNFTRVTVPDDVYECVVVGIEDKPVTTKGQFGERKRLILRWQLPTGGADAKYEEVTEFISPDVRKGSGAFQSTSTYVLLEKANLLGELKTLVGLKTKIEDAELIEFLKRKLIGKRALVMTSTVRPKDGIPPYSVVKTVVKFL